MVSKQPYENKANRLHKANRTTVIDSVCLLLLKNAITERCCRSRMRDFRDWAESGVRARSGGGVLIDFVITFVSDMSSSVSASASFG